MEARIVNAQEVEEGQPVAGEVAIRGAIVMKGYWNRPEASAEVLRDGWFHTGDLGYFVLPERWDSPSAHRTTSP